MKAARILLLALAFLGAAPPRPGGDPPFGSYWHDGKAELDGYRYTLTRYGQLRRGQAVTVYVTEPFSRSKNVKVNDASRNPADTFDVLKLNLVRDFQTGIYDYNTMSSLFVRSADFDPVKVSFSSTEWCGNVYEELRITPRLISQTLASYFEDESGTRQERRPPGGILEEDLFVRLRGLGGAYLAPGTRRTVPFLPGAFRRRLTHAPLKWESATIERLAEPQTVSVPAGRFPTTVYSVALASGPRGLFFVESAYPHRVVHWEWTQAADGDDSGELAGSQRLEYWKLHNVGDQQYLRDLGLLPGAPTPGKPAVPKSP
jgi:hypothetical protein